MDVSALLDIAKRGGVYGSEAQLEAIRSLGAHLHNPKVVAALNDIAKRGGVYGSEAQVEAIRSLGGGRDS